MGSQKKWIIPAVFFSVCLFLYAAGVLIFHQVFYSGSFINHVKVSFVRTDAARNRLIEDAENSRLEVLGRNGVEGEIVPLFSVCAEDIALSADVSSEQIAGLLRLQNPWLWFVNIWQPHEYSLTEEIGFDENVLEQIVFAQDVLQNQNMISPANAYLEGFSEESQAFVIVPEINGTTLEKDKVLEAVSRAVSANERELDLEEAGCYVAPGVTTQNDRLQRTLEQANTWIRTDITYDWNGSEVHLTKDKIKDWVFLRNGLVMLDENAVADFVAENAKANDTYRKEREFHTMLGYDLKLPGGAFGWLTDREVETNELIRLIKAGTVGEREPAYANVAPRKGEDDIGDSFVEIDLTHQHLYLHQDGEVVLESDFVSGNMSNGNATPQGVFGLTYKTQNAVLRGANYATPVKYWMPFNGNVGMHDATWRRNFGGKIYMTGGSHGCINLPLNRASEIYEYVSKGFPVVCYYYPAGMLEEELPPVSVAAEPQTPAGEGEPVTDPPAGELTEQEILSEQEPTLEP